MSEKNLEALLLGDQEEQFIDTSINRSSSVQYNQQDQTSQPEQTKKITPNYDIDQPYLQILTAYFKKLIEEKLKKTHQRINHSLKDIKMHWINNQETKFVTLNESNELQLYSLPHILKSEKKISFNFNDIKNIVSQSKDKKKNDLHEEDNEGNIANMIAISLDEKLVFIGSYKYLAVAKIEKIEDLFESDEIQKQFKNTINKISNDETIKNIFLDSNNQLIIIDQKDNINHCKDVTDQKEDKPKVVHVHDLIQKESYYYSKLKELSENNDELSIKQDLGKLTVIPEFGKQIEQYRHLIFHYDPESDKYLKKLKCYNTLTRGLMTFKEFGKNDATYISISGSFIFNDNEIIVKEGIQIRSFTYSGWQSNSFDESDTLGSLPETPDKYRDMELIKCYKEALYLCSPKDNGQNSHYVTIFNRKPTQNFILDEKTLAWNGGLINRLILRKSYVVINEKHITMINSGITQILEQIFIRGEVQEEDHHQDIKNYDQIIGIINGIPIYKYKFIDNFDYWTYSNEQLKYLATQMSTEPQEFQVVDYFDKIVVLFSKKTKTQTEEQLRPNQKQRSDIVSNIPKTIQTVIKFIFMSEMKMKNTELIENTDGFHYRFRMLQKKDSILIFSNKNQIFSVQIPTSSDDQITLKPLLFIKVNGIPQKEEDKKILFNNQDKKTYHSQNDKIILVDFNSKEEDDTIYCNWTSDIWFQYSSNSNKKETRAIISPSFNDQQNDVLKDVILFQVNNEELKKLDIDLDCYLKIKECKCKSEHFQTHKENDQLCNHEYFIKYSQNKNSIYLLNGQKQIISEIWCEKKIKQVFQDRASIEQIYIKSNDNSFYKLNIFRDGALSIPLGLLRRKDLYSKLEGITGILSYFESQQKSENHQVLSTVKIRSKYQNELDGFDEWILDQEVVVFIQNNTLQDILSYNILNDTHFLNKAITSKNPKDPKNIMEAFFEKLAIAHQDEIQFLFPEPDPENMNIDNKQEINKFNPNVFENCAVWMKEKFLRFMILSDSTGLMYHQILNRNLETLFSDGIDLKEYFNSSQVLHVIEEENYYYFNEESLRYLRQKYFKNEEDKSLKVESLKDELLKVQSLNQLTRLKRNLTVNEQISLEKEKLDTQKYYAIKVKYVQDNQKKSFAQVIDEKAQKDLKYLEIYSIQQVIDFKWNTYTYGHYQTKFFYFIIFIAALMSDFIYCQQDSGEMIEDQVVLQIFSKLICSAVMLYFIKEEAKQIMSGPNIKDYLTDFWNICDLLLFDSYYVYLLVSYFDQGTSSLQTVKFIIIALTFIKVTFFLRIIDQFSFMLVIIGQVVNDLKYFLLFFSFFTATSAVMLQIVLDGSLDSSTYKGTGSFGYFLMAFRSSVGDNDMADYLNTSGSTELAWIIWMLIIIVGNVILLNFIIAVFNTSYENCKKQELAHKYKVKIEMIIEEESKWTEKNKIIKKPEWFPIYIVVKRNANQTQDSNPMEEFVRQIKTSIESIDKSQIKSFAELKKAQEDSKDLILKEIKQLNASNQAQR